MGEITQLLAVVFTLVVINGLYVAGEFSLIGVRPTRIAQLASEGNAIAARIQRILEDRDLQDRYFATMQMGITAASLALGMYGEHKLAGILAPALVSLGTLADEVAHAVSIALAVGLLTYLHVVVGEMVPKSLALRYPEATTLMVARPVAISQTLFYPLVFALNHIGRVLLNLLRVPDPSRHERMLSREELAMIVAESAKGGLIPKREHQILLNIFDFCEREVHQTMTPRTKMVALAVDSDENTVARRLAESRHTRFPVYDTDLDHIAGTLHLKDFIRWRLDSDEAFDLGGLVRPARMVPEHMPARQLLETFREERGHMAIVIDEYGGTAGLVTLEDVAEELVGEMRDEFDVETPAMRLLRPGLLEVRGDLQLDALDDHVALPDDRPDVDTVGGLMLTLLGRPAQVGDRVELGDVTLTAQEVSGLALDAVQIAYPHQAAAPDQS